MRLNVAVEPVAFWKIGIREKPDTAREERSDAVFGTARIAKALFP